MAEQGVRRHWLAPTLAAAGMLAVLAIQGGLLLRATGGELVFALDDPYIHLAVAEEIARGGYGINRGEPASPSSSAAWPFLLVPVAGTPAGAVWVLALNVLAALVAAAASGRLADEALGGGTPLLAAVVGWFVLVIANAPALVFTGMEHTAHVAIAALVVLGLFRESRGGGVAWWFVLVLAAGPLIRFEHLALTVPAIALLWRRGRRRSAVTVAAATASSLVAFSLFLVVHGLSPVPTSVLAKLPAVRYGGVLMGPITTLAANLSHERGRMLLVALALLLAAATARRGRPERPAGERGLAAWGAAAIGLHLLFGDVGWLDRYEAYMMAAAALTLVAVFGGPLLRLLQGASPAGAALLMLAVALLPGFASVRNALLVPAAGAEVRMQPCEIHRFVAEYWQAPIAVNDIGCVAYRNDHQVLDLWGLASSEALDGRRAGSDPSWMERMALEAGVHLVAIHPHAFPSVPAKWIELGEFDLGRDVVVLAGRRVRFYARDQRSASRARPLLHAWAAGLPGDATYTEHAPTRLDGRMGSGEAD